jgi:hypothetical protein
MSSRTYVILTAAQALNIRYDDVHETSPQTLRWSNDNTKTFVKYSGETPSWLEGKTSYTHAQILSILNNPEGEWYTDPE